MEFRRQCCDNDDITHERLRKSMQDNSPLRVGVSAEELVGRPAQLRRIAEATGAEPVIWREGEPAPDIEALVCGKVPDGVPRETPRLRLLQLVSAGSEQLRDHPVWHSDVPIATASGVHGVQIAEHVFMLLLALRRHLPHYSAAQRLHLWRHDAVGDGGVSIAPGELYGLTLGLIGYGHIGRGVAHLARAFGMRVLATSYLAHESRTLDIPGVAPFADPPAVPAPSLEPDLMVPLARLDDLLAVADAVVVCAPLTAETEGLLDATRLARMKRGALLVNIARGKILVEDALARALATGQLGGAGLDVTAEEPLAPDSPLWEAPNVIVTPHISGNSERYAERVVNILLANIDCLRRGEPPVTAVERERGY